METRISCRVLSNGSGIFDYKKCLLDYSCEEESPYNIKTEVFNNNSNTTVAGHNLGKQDRTVLTILNKAGRMIKLCEWSNISYNNIIDNVVKMVVKYNVRSIVIESNSVGDAVIDIIKDKLPKSCKLNDFLHQTNLKMI